MEKTRARPMIKENAVKELDPFKSFSSLFDLALL